MIRFTIITCTYNAGKVLQRTLDSVAAQQWPDVEHIIIDGGSTDITVDMVREYERAQSGRAVGRTVKVVSEKDNGLYDAMNKGLARATGHYVVFVNAGDTLHAGNTLATVAARAAGDSMPAVIYGDTYIVDHTGRFLRRRRLTPPQHLDWRSFRNGMLVCHQAFYSRTDIAKAEPYNVGYRYSADVDWCIRVMKSAARQRLAIVNTDAVLADYLDGGMTTDNHRASLKERFKVMAAHYGMAVTIAMHVWFVFRALLRR